MFRQFVEHHASKMPAANLVRWRPVLQNGRLGGTDIFSLVEPNGVAESGFSYMGTRENVDGDHVTVRNSLVSMWDRVYHPYENRAVGDGIHFTVSSVWPTQAMLWDNNASNLQYMCKNNLMQLEDGKVRLVSCSRVFDFDV